jgi:hypothetical protein
MMKDWKYSEGCGCVVTFFAAADYRSSHMKPGAECSHHRGYHQVAARDCLMERAREARDEYLAPRSN